MYLSQLTRLLAITIATSTLLAVAPAQATCDPGEVVIKFSHVTNTNRHPKGIAATVLAERVNKEMNGRACMEVFPNSTLYNDDQVLEAMLRGDVHLAAPSLSKFETFTKKFRLFDLPFLFVNIDAVDRYQNSADGRNLLNVMTRKGLQGLAYWHNGMKQLSADRPLLVPADARGLKFRVQASDVLVAQFKALGANPQKMAFSEVYGALQTKVIDGQENTWSNIYGKKFFEVQDGTSETNHGIIDYMVVTSVDWWNNLNPAIRNQLRTILDSVTQSRNKESTHVNNNAREAIIKTGNVVRTLTPSQRSQWVAAMKPVWKEFEAQIGTDNIAAAQSYNTP